MSRHTLVASSVLLVALLVSNLYWYRRKRHLEAGLKTSTQWDSTQFQVSSDTDQRLEDVASILDSNVEDVVEAVRSLDDKVRGLQSDIDRQTDVWARTVRDALAVECPAPEGPLVVHLLQGDVDDARALASVLDHEGVVAVCAHSDVTFVVTVNRTADYSAIDIAEAATEDAAGGAGGSEEYAQGGGREDALLESIERVCATQTGVESTTLRLGKP